MNDQFILALLLLCIYSAYHIYRKISKFHYWADLKVIKEGSETHISKIEVSLCLNYLLFAPRISISSVQFLNGDEHIEMDCLNLEALSISSKRNAVNKSFLFVPKNQSSFPLFSSTKNQIIIKYKKNFINKTLLIKKRDFTFDIAESASFEFSKSKPAVNSYYQTVSNSIYRLNVVPH